MAEKLSKVTAGSPDNPAPFGKYFLLGLIARGGMAEVYRARDRTDADQLVAIKCMRAQLAKEKRFVEMFIREGKLALLLEHYNIVRTLEIGRSDGRYFITMEYISGRDLTQVLRRCQEGGHRIPVPHAVFIASAVCRGLHYAHVREDSEGRFLNVVNRDVSPSNVRIGYDGEVKLLDFGIAQAALKFTSEIGILKGKFSYMSPEQIRGMPVDARTDIFSTGILLHEMLTTEKLFRADSEFDLMEKVRSAKVAPPSKFNRRVPSELDDVVLRALAREPVDRFQTGEEFSQALDEVLSRYGFDQGELQGFMRQMFSAEYVAEQEQVEECLAAEIGVDRGDEFETAEVKTTIQKRRALPDTEPVRVKPRAEPAVVLPPAEPEPALVEPGQNKLFIWIILVAAIAIAATAVILLALRN